MYIIWLQGSFAILFDSLICIVENRSLVEVVENNVAKMSAGKYVCLWCVYFVCVCLYGVYMYANDFSDG